MGLFGSSGPKPEPPAPLPAPPPAPPTAAEVRYEKAKAIAQQKIRAIVDGAFAEVRTLDKAREAFTEIVRLVDAVAQLGEGTGAEAWPLADYCGGPDEDDRREEGDDVSTLVEDFEVKVVPFLTLGMPGDAQAALLEYLKGEDILRPDD